VYSTLGWVLSHANGHIMEPLELSLVSNVFGRHLCPLLNPSHSGGKIGHERVHAIAI